MNPLPPSPPPPLDLANHCARRVDCAPSVFACSFTAMRTGAGVYIQGYKSLLKVCGCGNVRSAKSVRIRSPHGSMPRIQAHTGSSNVCSLFRFAEAENRRLEAARLPCGMRATVARWE